MSDDLKPSYGVPGISPNKVTFGPLPHSTQPEMVDSSNATFQNQEIPPVHKVAFEPGIFRPVPPNGNKNFAVEIGKRFTTNTSSLKKVDGIKHPEKKTYISTEQLDNFLILTDDALKTYSEFEGSDELERFKLEFPKETVDLVKTLTQKYAVLQEKRKRGLGVEEKELLDVLPNTTKLLQDISDLKDALKEQERVRNFFTRHKEKYDNLITAINTLIGDFPEKLQDLIKIQDKFGIVGLNKPLEDFSDQELSEVLENPSLDQTFKELEDFLENIKKENEVRRNREAAEQAEERKQEEAKQLQNLFASLLPLSREAGKFSAEIEKLLTESSLNSETKTKLEEALSIIETSLSETTNTPSNETKTKLEESLREAEALIETTKTTLNEAKEKAGLSLGVLSGWPEKNIKFVDVKGDKNKNIKPRSYVEITDLNGNRKEVKNLAIWHSLKTDFEAVFSSYKTFFTSGKTSKKLELYKQLVISKNKIIEALLEEKTDEARALIDILRSEITETEKEWSKEEERITKENKEQEDKKIKLEGLKKEAHTLKKEINTALEKGAGFTPRLTSDLEVVWMEEKREELKKIEDHLENPTEKILKDLRETLSAYENFINKKEEVFSKMRPVFATRDILRSAKTNPNTRIITKGPDGIKREITLEEYAQEDDLRKNAKNIAQEAKKQETTAALTETLRKRFKDTPETFIALYAKKNKNNLREWVSESERDVVQGIFADYINEIQKSIASLENRLHTRSPDETDSPEILQGKINKFKSDIAKIENSFYQRQIDDIRKASEPTIAQNYKQTLRPEGTKSFSHILRAGENKPGTNWFKKIGKLFKGKKDTDRNITIDLGPDDVRVLGITSEEGQSDGMVRPHLDEQRRADMIESLDNDPSSIVLGNSSNTLDETARNTLGSAGVKDLGLNEMYPKYRDHALYNDGNNHTLETVEPVTPEGDPEIQRTRVEQLTQSIMNLAEREGWPRRVIVALFFAGVFVAGMKFFKEENSNKDAPVTPPTISAPEKPKTLGDLKTLQLPFESLFQTEEDKRWLEMIKSVEGESLPKKIEIIIKKFAPSVPFETTSEKIKIVELKCDTLINDQQLSGISEQERTELCDLVRKIEKTFQNMEASKRGTVDFVQNENSFSAHQNKTLNEILAEMFRALAEAKRNQ